MKAEITDHTHPEKSLTVLSSAKRGVVVIQIDGQAREVEERQLRDAVRVCASNPLKK